MEWIDKRTDHSGNTILHIAASTQEIPFEYISEYISI